MPSWGLWLPVYVAVFTHRKTFELAARLRLADTYAAAHVIRLWTWALTNAPHGDLSQVSARAIASGAGWEGDPRRFVSALIAVGWLNPDRAIHDWHEYGGKIAEQREANAERMRKTRAEARGPDVRRTSGARAGLEKSRGEKKRVEKSISPTPLPPAPQAGQGDGQTGGGNGAVTFVTVSGAATNVIPATPEDGSLWDLARGHLADMTAGNRESIERLAPLGRTADGGLCLASPPGYHLDRFRPHIARALFDAGDEAAARNLSIVELMQSQGG